MKDARDLDDLAVAAVEQKMRRLLHPSSAYVSSAQRKMVSPRALGHELGTFL